MSLKHIIKNLILVSFLLVGCASKWIENGRPYIDQRWRFCNEKYDKKLNNLGMCYITKECKKYLFGKKCRPKTLFCPFEPVEERLKCMEKYRLKDKIIVTRE
jgi:hypothetical protein